MRRTLLIPAAVALGAHALLLFGFSRPGQAIEPTPTKPPPPSTLVLDPPPLVVPPEPASADEDRTTSRTPRTAQNVPVRPETPRRVEPGDVTIQMPPAPPPRVPGAVVDRIAPAWSPDGTEGDGPGLDGVLFSPDLLDNPPRTRYQPAPQYPFSAKQSGLSGEVVVSFEVDERGAVLRPSVVRSTAREFEEPTLRAVEKWRFQPGRKDGRPVRFRMVVPVVFNLAAES